MPGSGGGRAQGAGEGARLGPLGGKGHVSRFRTGWFQGSPGQRGCAWHGSGWRLQSEGVVVQRVSAR